MPEADPRALLVERYRLAADLKRLREEARLTGDELAGRLGMSQSKLSKIETGKVGPKPAEVRRWAEVVGLSGERVDWLAERAERAGAETVSWRAAERDGLPRLQEEVAALESVAGVVRSFHPVLVPGLLQTAEVARLVVEAGGSRPDIAEAVSARIERQAVLYDQGHRFEFIVTEVALRWRFGSVGTQLAQLDRIASLATLPNVEVIVLPLAAELPIWHSHGFTLFEERRDGGDALAHAEARHAGMNVSEETALDDYRQVFAALWARGLTGPAASDLLATVQHDLRAASDS